MRVIEHNGVKVWEEAEGLRIYHGVDTASWERMEKAGWPDHLWDGWKKQHDKEIEDVLKEYRG